MTAEVPSTSRHGAERRGSGRRAAFEFRRWSREAGGRGPACALWFRLIASVGHPILPPLLLPNVDYHLLETLRCRIGLSYRSGEVMLASIDTACVPPPLRVDEWLLYALVSPSSSGSRGLAFDASRPAGRLVRARAGRADEARS